LFNLFVNNQGQELFADRLNGIKRLIRCDAGFFLDKSSPLTPFFDKTGDMVEVILKLST